MAIENTTELGNSIENLLSQGGILAGISASSLKDILKNIVDSLSSASNRITFTAIAEGTDHAATTEFDSVVVPASLNGANITSFKGYVSTPGVDGTGTIQLIRRRAGTEVDVLSTVASLASGEYSTTGAVINAAYDDLQTGDILISKVVAVNSTTDAKGLYLDIGVEMPSD